MAAERRDLVRAQRAVPDPRLVERALERVEHRVADRRRAEREPRVRRRDPVLAEAVRADRHAVAVEVDVAAGADAGDVVPGVRLPGQRIRVGVGAGHAAVAGGERDRRGVRGDVAALDPQRVRELLIVGVALEEDRPVAADGEVRVVELHPGVERDVARDLERGRAGHPHVVLVAGEAERPPDLAVAVRRVAEQDAVVVPRAVGGRVLALPEGDPARGRRRTGRRVRGLAQRRR